LNREDKDAKGGEQNPKKRKKKAIVLSKSHVLSSILISVDLQSQKGYPESQLVFGGVRCTCQFMFHPAWN
jgi:hypothetical protein